MNDKHGIELLAARSRDMVRIDSGWKPFFQSMIMEDYRIIQAGFFGDYFRNKMLIKILIYNYIVVFFLSDLSADFHNTVEINFDNKFGISAGRDVHLVIARPIQGEGIFIMEFLVFQEGLRGPADEQSVLTDAQLAGLPILAQ